MSGAGPEGAGPWSPQAGDTTWPQELRSPFERAITAEYASLSSSGTPVTVPVTPYVEPSRNTIDLSTGLTYPAKAERARRDPRVCLLFGDPVGRDVDGSPVVVVQGLATVRDSDLQANTDRYVRLSLQKLPAATAAVPRSVLRRVPWYFARIWVEVTPLHMKWWRSRDLSEAPSQWDAPEGTAAPLSDPAPVGKQPRPWLAPPASWRDTAERSLRSMELSDITTIDANGFPLCVPVKRAGLVDDGFLLELGVGAPELHEGSACLTMHVHDEEFSGQENRTFVGSVEFARGHWRLKVERVLGHWSLPGGRLRKGVDFWAKGRKLSPRLAQEAKRRFQRVPAVRFPDEL
jgi:hypothetical protein